MDPTYLNISKFELHHQIDAILRNTNEILLVNVGQDSFIGWYVPTGYIPQPQLLPSVRSIITTYFIL